MLHMFLSFFRCVVKAMASLLSALVQVIEQRISNQADNLKNVGLLMLLFFDFPRDVHIILLTM